MARWLFPLLLLLAMAATAYPQSRDAQTEEQNLAKACQGLVAGKYAQWRLAPPPADLAAYAERTNLNTAVVYGDFDADSRRDVALLIQDGPRPETEAPARLESLHIAVCLNATSQMKLYLINDLYCGDGIALTPKGRRYHDYENETDGVYELDGVSAYCFEKAGATYLFDHGKFRRVVDSD